MSASAKLRTETSHKFDEGVTIHIPCDSIRFQLLSFDFDYFDSIMQMFLNSYNITCNVNNMQP